jgi:rsbT co-antagonist protein RsbR
MSELSAFARAFEARREQVVARLLEISKEQMPQAFALAPESFRERVGRDVDAQIATIEDPEARALKESAQRWCTEALARATPPGEVLRLFEAARQVLLDVGLALHAEGVPGARAGIRRMVTAQSEVVRIFDGVFRERAERAHAQAQIFEALVRFAPYAIGIADLNGVMTYTNRAYREMMGAPDEPLEGRTVPSLLTPESRKRLLEEGRDALVREEMWTAVLDHQRADGSVFPAQSTTFIVHDPQGGAMKCAICRDMTEMLRAEQTRRELQEEVMAAQDAALRELGTPLVPIADGVVAMPLVGAIDEARAERMLDALLEGITREGAQVAILDITGVRDVDARAAGGLLAAARAARLLGTEVVLTGVQPSVAQALVEIGADLGSIATRATLSEGVRFALGRTGR